MAWSQKPLDTYWIISFPTGLDKVAKMKLIYCKTTDTQVAYTVPLTVWKETQSCIMVEFTTLQWWFWCNTTIWFFKNSESMTINITIKDSTIQFIRKQVNTSGHIWHIWCAYIVPNTILWYCTSSTERAISSKVQMIMMKFT